MGMNAKQAKAAKAKQDETVLNRVLCWIAGGSVLEFLLLLLNRYYNNYTIEQLELRVALGTAVKILAVAALILAGAAWYWRKSTRGNGKFSVFPGVATAFLLGVSVSCFCIWIMGSAGLRLMYLGVPVVIVVALIYYLYQHEFFMISCMSGIGLLGIWICSKALGGQYAFAAYLYLVLAAVVAVGGAILCRRLQANNGTMEVRGEMCRILPAGANYVMLYVTAIIDLAALIACVLSVPAMILLGILVAWLLVMAVYYTIKMM